MRSLISSAVDGAGKLALQRAHGRTGRTRRRRVDQIGDRFSLSQIQLAIEKGATTEFTGLGEAGTEVKAARQQHLHDDRATVSLQFKNVFASKGMRIREKQQ